MKFLDALMIATVAGGTLLLATADASLGQDRLVVPLPDISSLSQSEAQSLTRQIVEADVITSNCPAYAISDGAWTLLTGTGELLAGKLDMDPAAYEQEVIAPAYALLDDPESCDRIGPEVDPLIDRLIDMGGATEPNPSEPRPTEAG
ncbi:hypothetical protein PAF17_11390 [Paracoccus sp. Z330]|uniref:Uncharacterized protein n=1 Tax=Paracoccus onchidii TaxID=3017813 RepID=A0ABT4ZFS6_9RHOB|nr:hypothetical protein [Paracoccus onchidii]MDB6178099.1 hypothetical protein [Paracoccus onchidii]